MAVSFIGVCAAGGGWLAQGYLFNGEADVNVEVGVHPKEFSSSKNSDLPMFIQAMPQAPDLGKDTRSLHGFDSDHNQLRDDLQLLIAHKFPNQPLKRASLIQLARAYVNIIAYSGTPRQMDAVRFLHLRDMAERCVYDAGLSKAEIDEVTAQSLNNIKRKEALAWMSKKASEKPVTFKFPVPEQACDPDVIENQIALQEWEPVS